MTDRRRRKPARPPGVQGDGDALVGNAGDREQVRRAKKLERNDHDDELADLRAVASTSEGQRFLWRLMAQCHTFESTFDVEPHQHAFNAGERNIGNQVLASLMEAEPNAFLQMIEVHRKESET